MPTRSTESARRARKEDFMPAAFFDGQPSSLPTEKLTAQQAIARVRHVLAGNMPTGELLERYRPELRWFLRPECAEDIHGIGHEARVLIWQELLARLLIKDGMVLNQEALRWAAATHDTQRVSDGSDYPHGQRAAAWVAKNLNQRLPARVLDTVLYLDTWHVPSDNLAPEMTPELAVFKDADALDRVRIYDLDPRYLRCSYARLLLYPLAEELFEASEARRRRDNLGAFDSVMAAALDLGLLVSEAAAAHES